MWPFNIGLFKKIYFASKFFHIASSLEALTTVDQLTYDSNGFSDLVIVVNHALNYYARP